MATSTEEELQDSVELEERLHGQVLSHIANINYSPDSLDDHCLETALQQSMLSQYYSTVSALLSNSSVEVLTWTKLEAACQQCPTYQLLHQTISQGVPEDSRAWDLRIKPFHHHRHSLSTLGPVVLLHDRPVIPAALRQQVLQPLHGGHAGANMMFERAATCLYWPNY